MAKKEFSTDFTQLAGNTPLAFRVLVENPNTGTEYWATVEQTQNILQANLNTEAQARIAADTALQASIDMALVLGLD